MILCKAEGKSFSLSHTVSPLRKGLCSRSIASLGALGQLAFSLAKDGSAAPGVRLSHLASFKGNQKSWPPSDTLCLWDPKAGLCVSFDPAW